MNESQNTNFAYTVRNRENWSYLSNTGQPLSVEGCRAISDCPLKEDANVYRHHAIRWRSADDCTQPKWNYNWNRTMNNKIQIRMLK